MPTTITEKQLIFLGENYYRVMDDGAVGDGYPRDITIWAGLPFGRIDAAINFQNSRTYFFSGGDYYRFNDRQFEVRGLQSNCQSYFVKQ